MVPVMALPTDSPIDLGLAFLTPSGLERLVMAGGRCSGLAGEPEFTLVPEALSLSARAQIQARPIRKAHQPAVS